MKQEFLKQRLELSEDLIHYISINQIEKVKKIEEEIKNFDLIINKYFNN